MERLILKVFVARSWRDEDKTITDRLMDLIRKAGMEVSETIIRPGIEPLELKEATSIVESDAFCAIVTYRENELISQNVRTEISIAKLWRIPSFVFVDRVLMGEGYVRTEITRMIHGLPDVHQWYEFDRNNLLSGIEDAKILDFLDQMKRKLEDETVSKKQSREAIWAALEPIRGRIAPFNVGLEIIADAYDQDPAVIYDAAANAAAKITGARFAFVGLIEREPNWNKVVLKGFEGVNLADKRALQSLDLGFDDEGNTKGITGYVAWSKKSFVEGNLQANHKELAQKMNIHFLDPSNICINSELCVPILVKGHAVGVIDVEDTARMRFSEIHQIILQWLAKIVAITYTGEQFESLLRAMELIALGEATADETILRALMRWSQADYGLVALTDPQGKCFVKAIEDKELDSEIKKKFVAGTLEVVPGSGLCGQVLKSGEAQYVEDVNEPSKAKVYLPWWKATISETVLPILSMGDKVVGIINLEYKRSMSFAHVDKRLFQNIANLVAIVLNKRD